VAKKSKRKKSWLKTLLFVLLTPFVVWALAFLIWLYWPDITRLLNHGDKPPPAKAGKAVQRSSKPSDKSAHEGIGEEERKRLEEILKRKN
jgi:hypothetical protein